VSCLRRRVLRPFLPAAGTVAAIIITARRQRAYDTLGRYGVRKKGEFCVPQRRAEGAKITQRERTGRLGRCESAVLAAPYAGPRLPFLALVSQYPIPNSPSLTADFPPSSIVLFPSQRRSELPLPSASPSLFPPSIAPTLLHICCILVARLSVVDFAIVARIPVHSSEGGLATVTNHELLLTPGPSTNRSTSSPPSNQPARSPDRTTGELLDTRL
jgi:hypothetical protein